VNQMRLNNRRIRTAWRSFEAILETCAQPGQRHSICEDVDPFPGFKEVAPHVVNAMDVIRMAVGVHHRVEMRCCGRDHLLPEVWTGIDRYSGRPAITSDPFHKRSGPAALVLWIERITISPVTVRPRNTRRRAAPNDRET